MPLVIGIRASNNKIPAKPMNVPKTIFSHTIQKHMPTPKVKAPIIPNTARVTILPFNLIGALCSIFLHMIRVINPKIMPNTPKTMPGLNASLFGVRLDL